jgi:hypothetical protein
VKRIPRTKDTLLLRTDFSDDAAWESLCAAIQTPVGAFRAYVSSVSDRAFEGAALEELVPLGREAGHRFVFIADRHAITDPERSVLVVDLTWKPGQSFRVIPSEAGRIENNLSVANMGFADFAETVDEDGVFRKYRNV